MCGITVKNVTRDSTGITNKKTQMCLTGPEPHLCREGYRDDGVIDIKVKVTRVRST